MKEDIKKILSLVNSKTKIAALPLIARDPRQAAVFSKLVSSSHPLTPRPGEIGANERLTGAKIREISDFVRQNTEDNENILKIFPDIDLAMMIRITSILSPKDMVDSQLNYIIDDPALPSTLIASIVDYIGRYLEKHYDLSNRLPEILEEALFTSGAYITAILPESSLDEMINSTIENASNIGFEHLTTGGIWDNGQIKPLGFLGNPSKDNDLETNHQQIGLESFFSHQKRSYNSRCELPSIEIIDNFEVLKLPKASQSNMEKREKTILSRIRKPGLESYHEVDIQRLLYKPAQSQTAAFIRIKTPDETKRKSLGAPFIINLSSMATIPVHVPGEPRNHVGYFVLLDEEFNPLCPSSSELGAHMMNPTMTEGSKMMESYLLDKAKRQLVGKSPNKLTLDNKLIVFSQIVEEELLSRLKSGSSRSTFDLSTDQSIYRIMFMRSLQNRLTRLLYIPGSLVSYITFDYFPNGIGRSVFDKITLLASLRGILRFVGIMARSKDAINQTNVEVTLSENEPDPMQTLELISHEIMRMHQGYLPVGLKNPLDLVSWIQRMGINITFKGHPGFPQTSFDFTTRELNHRLPDTELEETLRKETYMACGVTPEAVDNAFSGEFATTYIINNALMGRQVMKDQKILLRQIKVLIHKTLLPNQTVRTNIARLIRSNYEKISSLYQNTMKEKLSEDQEEAIDYLVDYCIMAIQPTLPKADTSTLTSLKEEYDAYSEAVDRVIEDALVNENLMSSNAAGDIAENTATIKAALKAIFLRDWMATNNYLPEVSDILSTNTDGQPIIDVNNRVGEIVNGLYASCKRYVEGFSKKRKEMDADLEQKGLSPESGGYSAGEDTTENEGDFDFGDMGKEEGASTEESSTSNEAENPEEETESDQTEETPDKEGEGENQEKK